MNVGLIGRIYAQLPKMVAGICDAFPDARPVAIGSGSVKPFAQMMDAWCFLHEENLEDLAFLQSLGKPIVSRVEATGVPAVFMDDTTAATQLAQHCIKQGATALYYCGVQAGFSQRRSLGTSQAAAAANLPYRQINDAQELVQAITKASDLAAVVCMNDARAYELMQLLNAAGYPAPSKVMLCGFDNIPLPDFEGAISLTTVALPDFEQGRTFGKILQQDGLNTPLKTSLPVTDFYHRTSTVRSQSS